MIVNASRHQGGEPKRSSQGNHQSCDRETNEYSAGWRSGSDDATRQGVMQGEQQRVHRPVRRKWVGTGPIGRAGPRNICKSLQWDARESAVHTTPARTAAAAHLHKPKLTRRCRECVHEVDNVSEDKSPVRQRIRTETDRTVTSSLPARAVLARVNRARGARGPLTLRGVDDEGR